jgi:uncharacterized protein YjiS (DUF1127 family)
VAIQAMEIEMLRQIFKSLIVARQASAAFETLSHLSDHQLQDIGFTRATYVNEIKAQVLAEMDAADEEKAVQMQTNPNLVGAV